MNVIAVSPCRYIGYFKVTIKRTGSSRPYCYDRLKECDAAAKALELSMGCVGKFQILGSSKALNMIRSGGIIGENQ